MKTLYIETERETYAVDDDNNIYRPSIGQRPSGKWKLQGFVRYNNFGHQVDFVSAMHARIWPGTNQADQRTVMFYKNGKPKYHVRDLDCGTTREWGEGVRRIFVKDE